jgi:hypothetical protein
MSPGDESVSGNFGGDENDDLVSTVVRQFLLRRLRNVTADTSCYVCLPLASLFRLV